MTALLARL